MMRPKYELAQVIEQFYEDFVIKHNPNSYILRTLHALRICRTSALGGHIEKCDSCGHIRISYNSCRNRHCPKCQASKQAFWAEDVSERIIDTKYFHLVFTVPEVLNSICLIDSKKFYSTLFSSVWDTLRTFGYTHYGTESGAVAVLHTWGQNLSLHPHIHCLVPATGMTLAGHFKSIGKNGKFLYPVKKLSSVFRGKMMQGIKKYLLKKGLLQKHKDTINQAWKKKWVVFGKKAFGNAEHVIKYLGKYTHRIAISNNRIQNIDNESVSFFYKDYKNGEKPKLTKLSGTEFLRRFCMHILPKGFVKIRYYGILSGRYKKKIVLLRKTPSKPQKKESVQERFKRLTGFDVYSCPVCKKGRMYELETVPKIRSPENCRQKLKL